ncbi:uncharacterized protein [Ptychodera flava]|uniref:uncharacterized protein n=1 Tax=Ptychodera flava TaxID=63121 RepID=UPI00396A3C17
MSERSIHRYCERHGFDRRSLQELNDRVVRAIADTVVSTPTPKRLKEHPIIVCTVPSCDRNTWVTTGETKTRLCPHLLLPADVLITSAKHGKWPGPLRVLYVGLNDKLGTEEHETLITLVGDKIEKRRREQLKTPAKLFEELEDHGHISESDLTLLVELFDHMKLPKLVTMVRECERQLKSKASQSSRLNPTCTMPAPLQTSFGAIKATELGVKSTKKMVTLKGPNNGGMFRLLRGLTFTVTD